MNYSKEWITETVCCIHIILISKSLKLLLERPCATTSSLYDNIPEIWLKLQLVRTADKLLIKTKIVGVIEY